MYPGAIPSYAGFTAGHTLLADNHAAQSNAGQADIIALSTKVGTGASTPASGLLLRGNGAGTSAWAQVNLATDVTGSLAVANAALVLAAVYPVGCIYAETTGVNPSTTFGFGTWVQTAKGQVLIGQGTSDQAFVAGATGGESNHTLTGAESGTSVHGHGVTDPTHVHNPGNVFNTSNGATGGTENMLRLNNVSNQNMSIAAAATGVTVNNSTAANASSSHNNLPPYLVCYFWTRTA